MDNVMSQNPVTGTWEPAIPEPFWYRSWRTLWRWRPGCADCTGLRTGKPWTAKDAVLFKSRAEWQAHYRRAHLPVVNG